MTLVGHKKNIIIMNFKKKKLIRIIKANTDWNYCVVRVNFEIIASCGWDNNVVLWNHISG
jgi:hypothetical protein